MTGLLLAGIGHVDQQQKKNFLIVDSSASSLVTQPSWVIQVEVEMLTLSVGYFCRNADEHDRIGFPGLYGEEGCRDTAHQSACELYFPVVVV